MASIGASRGRSFQFSPKEIERSFQKAFVSKDAYQCTLLANKVSTLVQSQWICSAIYQGNIARAQDLMNQFDLSKLQREERDAIAGSAALCERGDLLTRTLQSGPTTVSTPTFLDLAERGSYQELGLILSRGAPIADDVREAALLRAVRIHYPINFWNTTPFAGPLMREENRWATFLTLMRNYGGERGDYSAPFLSREGRGEALVYAATYHSYEYTEILDSPR